MYSVVTALYPVLLCVLSSTSEVKVSNNILQCVITVLSTVLPSGYFMYIEASLMRPGHKARLLTSDLRGSSSPQCLIFYYHMYGSGTGILNILLRRGDREKDMLLWRRRGEQSISWMRAMVDYYCDVQHQVCSL